MSVTNPQKAVFPEVIGCGEASTVTLGFDAAANLVANPADIVLIMDRSYSMNADRMLHAKQGAFNLISTVAAASTGDSEGDLSGSRIGVVGFASSANISADLTTSRASLTSAIQSLASGGETNHSLGFKTAGQVLGQKGENRQIAVMFTDGITTLGGDAVDVTSRMKEAGIEIYCIGLLDDAQILNKWASAPLSEHVSCTSDQNDLEQLFERVAAKTVNAGAEKITVEETLSPEFKISKVLPPTMGSVAVTDDRTLVWSLDYAGTNLNPETYSLSFEMLHVGKKGGRFEFNQSVVYHDQDGTALNFPSPVIDVICAGPEIYPEPCPEPTAITVPHCKDAAHVVLKETPLLSLGRIVQTDVTVRSVCPGKRVAVSIILNEIDADGKQIPRGVKHILIPAQTGDACRDLTVKCVQFSVPEIPDTVGTPDSICNQRNFEAQVIANYIDTDFVCCPDPDVTV